VSVEIKGQQLRVRLLPPKRGWEYRVKDVGRKGHLQLVLMGKGKKRWDKYYIQSIRLNLGDYKSFDEISEAILNYIPPQYQRKALRLARKWWEKFRN